MREERGYSFNWTAWISWVLLTTLGWLVGWVLLDELWVGLALGASQWLFIRSRLEKSYRWVIASMVGWAAGHLLVIFWIPIELRDWAGLPIGLTLGAAQWLVLRGGLPRAGWWIVINALAWLLAMTGILGGSLVGAVAGAVTGVAAVLFMDLREAQQLKGESEE